MTDRVVMTPEIIGSILSLITSCWICNMIIRSFNFAGALVNSQLVSSLLTVEILNKFVLDLQYSCNTFFL